MEENMNFEELKKEALMEYFELNKYKEIMKNYKTSEVNSDDFQTLFNGFYNVRRNEDWRDNYYKYFQSIKNKKDIEFNDIIEHFYEENLIEPSFSSKLLSTINPKKPIWDNYVIYALIDKIDENRDLLTCKNHRYYVKGTGKNRIDNAIKVYEKIEKETKDLLKENYVRTEIKKFKTYFDDYLTSYKNECGYEFEDMKILDIFLWTNGKKKQAEEIRLKLEEKNKKEGN